MPAHATGFSVQRHDRTGVLFHGFAAVTAKIIRRCIACGDVDQPQLLIRAGQAPDVRRSPRVGLTLRRKANAVLPSHVPGPFQCTGHRIETPNDAGRFFGFLVIRTQPPKTRVSLATGGRGHKIVTGLISPMPVSRLTSPSSPKSEQVSPVSLLTAISLASVVAVIIRSDSCCPPALAGWHSR